MTDQLSGGLPFAPKPKSYADTAADYLHKARLWMDEHTPGFGNGASYLGKAGSAMGPAAGLVQQGGVLDPGPFQQRADARMKASGPFGGNANAPSALFGPATYPGVQSPLAQGFGQAPGASQVSDGGYNAIDAAANRPPVMASSGPSDSRANFIPSPPPRSPIDLQGMPQPDGSYNGLPQYARPYTPPPREETNGPDLIKKFMSYLNDKR